MDLDYNRYYEKVSKDYNELRLDPPNDFRATIEIICNAAPPKACRILDIGCGTGKYGAELTRKNFSVVGIDKSPDQIKEAEKVIPAYVGSACELPFPDNSFDMCLMIMMLHQLTQKERESAFKEIDRILRPNGMLIIKTASHDDIRYRLSSIYFPSAYDLDISRYPDCAQLTKELSNYKSVIMKNIVVHDVYEPELMADKFLKRRTSNLGMLSEEQLIAGVEKYKADFAGIREAVLEEHYTFIIGYK